jgi:hypothetical protein
MDRRRRLGRVAGRRDGTGLGVAPLPANQRVESVVPTAVCDGGSRQRRIGIVAVARRLMIELWRFVETGRVPEGAVLKA